MASSAALACKAFHMVSGREEKKKRSDVWALHPDMWVALPKTTFKTGEGPKVNGVNR